MADRDYYETLGVSRTADKNEIKKSYKRLAMKFHPDRNKGDKTAEARFKEVKKAYEILSDPQQRELYDQHGHAAFEQGGMGAGAGASFGDVFGDVFGDIFGGGRRGQGHRGSDLLHTIELTLEEAVRGAAKDITFRTLVPCDKCHGSGAREGTTPISCTTCRGAGQIQMRQGFFTVQQTCPQCHGQGKIIRDPCPPCNGGGRTEKSKTLSVKIPAGVGSGDRIRLTGEGEAGAAGSVPGDLYVDIQVKPHPIFQREDSNLYCEVPVSFTMAALGGEVEVPTLEGRVKLKIPPEVQSGKLFRMRSKGVKPARGGACGDLFCRVVVETPVNLNERQKELLMELEQSLKGEQSERHSPRSSSFFAGVKKFFEDLTGS